MIWTFLLHLICRYKCLKHHKLAAYLAAKSELHALYMQLYLAIKTLFACIHVTKGKCNYASFPGQSVWIKICHYSNLQWVIIAYIKPIPNILFRFCQILLVDVNSALTEWWLMQLTQFDFSPWSFTKFHHWRFAIVAVKIKVNDSTF